MKLALMKNFGAGKVNFQSLLPTLRLDILPFGFAIMSLLMPKNLINIRKDYEKCRR